MTVVDVIYVISWAAAAGGAWFMSEYLDGSEHVMARAMVLVCLVLVLWMLARNYYVK